MRRIKYLIAPLLLTMSGLGLLAPAAVADPSTPTPAPTPAQLHQAAVDAAKKFCSDGPLGHAISIAQAGGTCRKKLAQRLEADGGPKDVAAQGCSVFSDMVPSWFVGGGTAVRVACEQLSSLSDSLGTAWDTSLKAVVASVPGAGTALKVIDFVSNPGGEFDKLVNELHKDAVQLVTSVLADAGSSGEWDMRSGGYLERYGKAAAIGLVVMAFLFISAVREAADRGDRKEGERLLRALAIGFGTILFAPAVIYVLNNGSVYAASGFKGSVVTPSLNSAVDRLGSLGGVTAAAVPGGAFVGLLLFGLMLIGGVGLFIGNLVNQYGLQMAAIAIAILAGTRVHPRWEDRGKKAAVTILGLLMARPLVMLAVGWCCGIINDSLDPAQLSASPMQALTGLGIAAVAIVSLGLAPFALLKWLPLSPTRAASHDPSGGGHGVVGPVLGAAGGAAMGGWRGREGVQSRDHLFQNSSDGQGQSGPGSATGPGGTPAAGASRGSGRAGADTFGARAAGAGGQTLGRAGSAGTAAGSKAGTAGLARSAASKPGAAFAADALRQIGQSATAKAKSVAQGQGVEVEHDFGGRGGGS